MDRRQMHHMSGESRQDIRQIAQREGSAGGKEGGPFEEALNDETKCEGLARAEAQQRASKQTSRGLTRKHNDRTASHDRSVLRGARGARTLKALHGDVRHEGVEAFCGLLVLVALASAANTDAKRHVADAARPQELVQGGVDADVRSAHLLLGELLDLTQRTRSALLVATARWDETGRNVI